MWVAAGQGISPFYYVSQHPSSLVSSDILLSWIPPPAPFLHKTPYCTFACPNSSLWLVLEGTRWDSVLSSEPGVGSPWPEYGSPCLTYVALTMGGATISHHKEITWLHSAYPRYMMWACCRPELEAPEHAQLCCVHCWFTSVLSRWFLRDSGSSRQENLEERHVSITNFKFCQIIKKWMYYNISKFIGEQWCSSNTQLLSIMCLY